MSTISFRARLSQAMTLRQFPNQVYGLQAMGDYGSHVLPRHPRLDVSSLA